MTTSTDPTTWQPPRPVSQGFATQREHQLRVSAWCAIPGVTLTLAGVMLTDDYEMRPTVYTVQPTGNRVLTQQAFVIGGGMLTHLEVFASAGAPIGCQCYVRVELAQGQGGGALTSVATVCEGYVTANVALSYPGQSNRSTDGRGTFRTVVGTVPAAGADFLDTVPINTRWALQAVAFTLVTAVTVGNRIPILTIDDGTHVLWESSHNANVAASITANFRAGAGVQLFTIQANDFVIPLPTTLLLAPGSRIRSATGGIVAGDQYSAIVYNVEEWIDV
jgi:hypothetical protein